MHAAIRVNYKNPEVIENLRKSVINTNINTLKDNINKKIINILNKRNLISYDYLMYIVANDISNKVFHDYMELIDIYNNSREDIIDLTCNKYSSDRVLNVLDSKVDHMRNLFSDPEFLNSDDYKDLCNDLRNLFDAEVNTKLLNFISCSFYNKDGINDRFYEAGFNYKRKGLCINKAKVQISIYEEDNAKAKKFIEVVNNGEVGKLGLPQFFRNIEFIGHTFNTNYKVSDKIVEAINSIEYEAIAID